MLKKLKQRITSLRRILLAIALTILVAFGFSYTAIAGEATNGAEIFKANCAACHMGGGNIIIAHKTLKKQALEKYNMNSMAAIINQVKNGKSAMPAFRGRLTDEQISEVASFVLKKVETGW